VGPDLTGAATPGPTVAGHGKGGSAVIDRTVDPGASSRGVPRRTIILLAAVAVLAGCGDDRPPADPEFNDIDVMFLQMSIEYARQGDEVAALAESRGGTAEVRMLATGLRTQWDTESGTMRRWLLGWQRPLTADPGAHAGHGDHSLRPSDVAELRATKAAGFDRTALTLLVGHLHNCVEVTRMESAGGRYPQAKALAATMTQARQADIQRMLKLLA
jgi:uncharacterized protein (DUF305 family)